MGSLVVRCFLQTLLLQRNIGPKKGRRVGKIDVPKETPTEFQFGKLMTHRRGGKRGSRKRGVEEAQKQREERQREEAMREKTTHSAEEEVTKKCVHTNKSDTEMNTEGGGEAATSQ